ncbi:chromate transporter [Aquisalibacillus elongatus]|uniref:Chromate transporter n=1 Tax=Aquisalibacillus elongatus TaxID=485577 RepID=A0A3N5B9A1_9BACI|nr:chromate transporter [Aquisalibacillus elongatus]RPF54306.1 chromate transporter [Aquisalibacillus elongatus]
MRELWELLVAFFIPGVVGYGGGPASIPLIEHEVVKKYEFMSTNEFGEVLALANSLPGPIATKMAGYIGFEVAGTLGSIVALSATIVPSLAAMLALLGLLNKYKDSPKVKRISAYVRPTIAVLMGVLTFQFFDSSVVTAGWIQTILLVVVSLLLLEKFKVHPAFVVAGSLVYGAIFLS